MSVDYKQHILDLRSAVALYAARGWRVIPLHYGKERNGVMACSCWRGQNVYDPNDIEACGAPAKHPMLANWRSTATTDQGLLKRWWLNWPLANIGLLMGGAANLIAIDIDGEAGRESLVKLENLYGVLPVTLTQSTGREGGGEHRLFTVDAAYNYQLRNRVHIAPSIDLRASGGYIIGSPSYHFSGALYRWHDSNTAIAKLPEWFFRLATGNRAVQEMFSANGSRPKARDLPPLKIRKQKAKAALLEADPAISGQNGSLACLRAAILVIRGYCLPPKSAFDLLWDVYNPRCVPPWTEEELMHKIASAELHVDVAWRYKISDVGGDAVSAIMAAGFAAEFKDPK